MTTMARVRATAKARDAWWTVVLIDPLALRLVAWSARRPWVTPNRLTMVSFLSALAAAAAYAQGSRSWLLTGAVAYHVAFVLDCMDGKLARLTGTDSVIGQWLDFMLDRVGVTLCALALFGGQYLATGEDIVLVLGAVVVFLNIFHQLNGQIMVSALRRARDEAARDVADAPDRGAPPGLTGASGWFARLRAALGRHRIRADVFSAVEFQMAILIVGPVLGLVVPVTIAACALLVAFEGAAVVKFTLTARALQRGTRAATSPRASAPVVDRALEPDGAGSGR